MKQRDRETEGRPRGSAMKGLVLPVVLLCAVSAANAQSSSPVEGGGPAPTAEKAEPPQTPAQDSTDGFKVAGFVFKVGGRIKLDIIKD